MKGIQDFGLSLIEAALVMTIIEMRASREQIEQSLALIKIPTDESTGLIADSIAETKHAAEESLKMTREASRTISTPTNSACPRAQSLRTS